MEEDYDYDYDYDDGKAAAAAEKVEKKRGITNDRKEPAKFMLFFFK